jgi:hypothetical protein
MPVGLKIWVEFKCLTPVTENRGQGWTVKCPMVLALSERNNNVPNDIRQW